MIKLRKYQLKCINGVKDAFGRVGGYRVNKIGKYRDRPVKKVDDFELVTVDNSPANPAVLLVAPTGAGKTVMFAYMAQATADKGNNVLVMAHRKELCTQCGAKLLENGVTEFGYINPRFSPDYNQRIQVGTIQSIVARLDRLRAAKWKPDFIIIDEAHRSLAETYLDILMEWPDVRVLGVTATPVRGDGRPLSDLYDELVLGPTIRELIGGGFLVKPRTFYAKHEVDLSKVKVKKNGEYNLKSLEKAVDQVRITGDAVDHYRRICDGVPAVAFCVSIKHAQHVSEQFRAAGYKTAHIDGTMSDKERGEILATVARGELNVVTSVDLITEGFDAPMLQCAIMLRPTKSLGLFIQMAGRVLRIFEGKYFAYVLDHAGFGAKHWYVDDDREWSLEGVAKDESGIDKDSFSKGKNPMRQCIKCYALYEKILPACSFCGHVYEVKSREVALASGVLVEHIRDGIGIAVDLDSLDDGDTKLLDQLRVLAQQKGYSDQWVFDIYNEAIEQGLC